MSKLKHWLWDEETGWLYSVCVFFYSRSYGAVQKFLHKHGLHYAPKQSMPQGTELKRGLDGKPVYENYHWCQWCGLRGTTIEVERR
jgi:hypothetical protein